MQCMPPFPTANGTHLAGHAVRSEPQPMPTSEGMASSHTSAEAGEVEAGVAVGAGVAEDGAATGLAGAAGPADGDLASVGVLAGILFGRSIRILIGTTSHGVILTATLPRLTTFILIPPRGEGWLRNQSLMRRIHEMTRARFIKRFWKGYGFSRTVGA